LGLFLLISQYLIDKKFFNPIGFVRLSPSPYIAAQSLMERQTAFHTYFSKMRPEIPVTY